VNLNRFTYFKNKDFISYNNINIYCDNFLFIFSLSKYFLDFNLNIKKEKRNEGKINFMIDI